MSIQEWAAVAEIIGAVALVASLIYLAIQVRHSTHELSMSLKSTELAAFERNVESGIRIRELFICNPEILELYARGIESYLDLDEDDKLRFDMILRNVFSALQGAYVRQLTYGNDPTHFSGSERTLDRLVRGQGIRDWLSHSNPDWRPEFATLVQQRVHLFEETADEAEKAEKASGAERANSSKHSAE
ncbi:MAG: hypothetical protein OEM30_03685 [Gammaproteobacteria bacterium]|nr:hypothetical protein [Gammaproteobacteria bacterium]MDH3811143.1 hypothetical protein [Gammaproteobacteria bacterium]